MCAGPQCGCDDCKEGDRHGKVERQRGRDRFADQRAHQREDPPQRAHRCDGSKKVGDLFRTAHVRAAFIFGDRDSIALIHREIRSDRALPQGGAANMRCQRR